MIKSVMKKHEQKVNREYWGKGMFTIANISLTSDKTEDLRCVLSI
jgi:hypothetical protein